MSLGKLARHVRRSRRLSPVVFLLLSFGRTALGLAIGVMVGIVLALIAGLSRQGEVTVGRSRDDGVIPFPHGSAAA